MYLQAKSKIVSWKTCWKSKNFNTVEPRLTATLVIWSPRFTAPFLATWQNGHTFLVKKKNPVNADYFFWPIVDRINEVPLYNKKTTNNIRDCKPIWTVLINQWYNNGATVNPILTPFKAGLKEMGPGGEGGLKFSSRRRRRIFTGREIFVRFSNFLNTRHNIADVPTTWFSLTN